MTTATWLLLGVVGLLAANRALYVGGLGFRHRRLFWSVQLLDFGAACALAGWGLPGIQGRLKVVNLLLCGLLVLHVVQNNQALRRAVRRRLAAGEDGRDDELRRVVLSRLGEE